MLLESGLSQLTGQRYFSLLLRFEARAAFALVIPFSPLTPSSERFKRFRESKQKSNRDSRRSQGLRSVVVFYGGVTSMLAREQPRRRQQGTRNRAIFQGG